MNPSMLLALIAYALGILLARLWWSLRYPAFDDMED